MRLRLGPAVTWDNSFHTAILSTADSVRLLPDIRKRTHCSHWPEGRVGDGFGMP